MRLFILIGISLAASSLAACLGGSGASAQASKPSPAINTMAVIVDSGPIAGAVAVNHAYVAIKVCAAGSGQCANIDHILVDTGSWGLRLVRSVLTGKGVVLAPETDASGINIEECVKFGAGQTWGPVSLADVTLAAELASRVPVQVMDDTAAGAPPPVTCGPNGTLLNDVSAFNANGVLGIGVFAQDCGSACATAMTPLPIYYGCTTAGVCTAENVPLSLQVTNPVAMFGADNNGIIVNLPHLQNANGDASVQGELIFGIGTQPDNGLPASGLTVLGADKNGDFTATYNGNPKVLPARIDSGNEANKFDDPSIAVCTSALWVGYYCPAAAPQSVFADVAGVGVNNAVGVVNFAIADPNSFAANATAFIDLAGGGGSANFTFGMPFFYGRKIYFAIDQRIAGAYTGPYYAY